MEVVVNGVWRGLCDSKRRSDIFRGPKDRTKKRWNGHSEKFNHITNSILQDRKNAPDDSRVIGRSERLLALRIFETN